MFDLVKRIGNKVEILSRTEVRYVGNLTGYDPQKETITLAKVRSFGTENREAPIKMQASTQIYEYIVFRLVNIKRIRDVADWSDVKTGEVVGKKREPEDTQAEEQKQKVEDVNTEQKNRPNKSMNEPEQEEKPSMNEPEQKGKLSTNQSEQKNRSNRKYPNTRRNRGQYKYSGQNSCLRKNVVIPSEEYDFNANNKEFTTEKKESEQFKKTYDPSFFYDSLS